jgi:hypothetical protein
MAKMPHLLVHIRAWITRCQVDLNPMRACVPSQKGLVALPPQRHNFAAVTLETTLPVPLVISRLPRTDNGPLS